MYGYTSSPRMSGVTSFENPEVTDIVGDHKEGRTDDDVQFFASFGTGFRSIPLKLTDFYKNLEGISITISQIKKITKNDLTQFGNKLTRFYFRQNEHFEVIEADLFEGTPNLARISFYYGKIKYVEKGAFDKLTKLEYLSFEHNPCISEVAETREEVLALIPKIEANCNEIPKNYLKST